MPFDIDATRRYADLAVTAKTRGRGFQAGMDCLSAAGKARIALHKKFAGFQNTRHKKGHFLP
ncbi:hypothetical protein [Cupriavidus sp. CuC1]|uniref:hypothetical protein n=1 Tax=Cupriavidus sp. CuC1 TaxID=3373131 RepID=UPI0037D0572F